MSETEHHICPVRLYVCVFLALMVFTVITVGVALVDMGIMNNVVMLAIAVFKASLVIFIFMHLKYNPKILWFIAIGAFVWLGIMLALTLSDVMTRGWMPNQPETWL